MTTTDRTGNLPCTVDCSRYDGERADLVAQLVASERRVRLLERALREYAEVKDDDPSVGSMVSALLARIAGLEANQERLLSQNAALESKLRKAR